MSTAPDAVLPDPYEAFLRALRDRFVHVVGEGSPLFTTDAAGLFDTFLGALPAAERPIHTCAACRRFVDTYGGLVAIRPSGRTEPALWDGAKAPELYALAVRAVERIVGRATVTGVHLTSEAIWGRPVTGAWHHLAVTPPAPNVFVPTPVQNAYQAAAERRADHETLQRALADFPAELVHKALAALSNGALFRSEKCIGVARWLADLHAARADAKGALARDHVTWRAVATAPPGFCHVRTTMIGTLLEDLAAGLPFAEVKRRFDAKTDPTLYQRPQAAPSAGNIAVAEKIVAALRSAGALARRYATLADIVPLWTPPGPPRAGTGGVFGHLAPKPPGAATEALDLPPVTLTWEKLARTVLPEATRVECRVPTGNGSFYAFVTATNPDAPPIVQWDRPDRRNPVTWYTHANGSAAAKWGLAPDTWSDVTAITLFPQMWHGGGHAHQGDGALFVIGGARPTERENLCLFPEFLKSEYHAIRSTIEAFSRAGQLDGRETAEVCGLGIRKGQALSLELRVSPARGPATVYRLDRWD